MATKEEILGAFDSKEGAWFAYNEGMRVGYNEAFNSLRNQAAISAMQGLLCAPSYKADNDKLNMIAKDAVSIADALIEELKNK